MSRSIVAVVRYEKPLISVRKAVELSGGLDRLSSKAKVFIKPNIVFWTKEAPFPKWGVITTSRVVEDMVVLLKERGIDDITIGEGTVLMEPKDRETPEHAFETLGYNVLKKRYGVRCINVHERPFDKANLGQGVTLDFNSDMLESDFLVNIPVLKTHAQTVVSLGIKNLKGLLNIRSRQKCHSADPDMDLNAMVAKLANVLPPCFVILDGIYTNERGPGFDGTMRRSNLLVASSDILSADMVGARLLGYKSSEIPHLAHVARDCMRPTDLSDLRIVGERIENLESFHEYSFPYTEDESLPMFMERKAIQGLSYRKYDLTICTYCSSLTRVILMGIAKAWNGKAWDGVEVLTGKIMQATPGEKKTILIGKCICRANKNNPNIKEAFSVKGCPPSMRQVAETFRRAGIPVDPSIFENKDRTAGMYMKKYEGKPEFDESFFRIH